MNRLSDKTPLLVITGLILTAVILGYLSFPREIIVLRGTAHPYKNPLNDGCYQIFGAAILDRPGCFVLQKDLVLEGDNEYFLYINSSDVQVDLKGKTVTGPGQSSTQSGIYINGGDNIRIANGSISGFLFGIRGEPTATGEPLKYLQLRNLEVSNASLIGIMLAANEVYMSGTRVEAPGEVKKRKYDYSLDIRVEAETCYYQEGMREGASLQPPSNPLVALPDHCVIEN